MKMIRSSLLFASLAIASFASAESAVEIVKKYYAAYNKGDADAQAALMTDNVRHEPNQGEASVGRDKYLAYAKDLKQYVDEKCVDHEFFTSSNPNKVITEFYAVGKYIKTIEGYPKANKQSYKLRAVEVFEIENGKISRLSTHYNDKEWIRLISPKAK